MKSGNKTLTINNLNDEQLLALIVKTEAGLLRKQSQIEKAKALLNELFHLRHVRMTNTFTVGGTPIVWE